LDVSTIEEIEKAIRGLSPDELASLRARLAERDPLERATAGCPSMAKDLKFPPSAIQPARIQDREERRKAFEAWIEMHRDITAIADDSRESIYEGRGE
jgi:hypothetical protein